MTVGRKITLYVLKDLNWYTPNMLQRMCALEIEHLKLVNKIAKHESNIFRF
jgi:hypothetical protein